MNTHFCAGKSAGQGSDPWARAAGTADPDIDELERPKARRINQSANETRSIPNQTASTIPVVREKIQTNTKFNSEIEKDGRSVTPNRRASARRGIDPSRLAGASPDLRRRSRRAYAETLVQRAAWLPATDRELVEAVFDEGLSVAAYVRRMRERGADIHPGRSALTARAARRRLRGLIARVLSPRFVFVVERRTAWAASRRRVAMACVVRGLSLREAAAALGMSLHAVRRHMDAVDALCLAHLEQAGGAGPRR